MEYTSLGRTGMQVSRLCLGTMNFGTYTDEKTSFRIMDMALDAGINFFDTADVYGDKGNKGLTESLLGRWFQQGGNRREKVVLATKVYGNMEDENDGPNMGRGLSSYKIRRHCEASMRRLQTDHIELYQMHHIDREVTWPELWEAFQRLVQNGSIDYVGSSNFAAWNIVQAQNEAEKRYMLGLVCEQHKYSLLCRTAELELLPACKALGIGVIPWGPLGGGMLTCKVLNPDPNTRAKKAEWKVTPAIRAQLEAYEALCREIGSDPSSVALAWHLHNDAITAPIIGPRTPEQLISSLSVVDLKLSKEILDKLDEIFPGPGGGAPEAYAW